MTVIKTQTVQTLTEDLNAHVKKVSWVMATPVSTSTSVSWICQIATKERVLKVMPKQNFELKFLTFGKTPTVSIVLARLSVNASKDTKATVWFVSWMTSACSTSTFATNMQLVSILKQGMIVSVMMDSWVTGTHVKMWTSAKVKLIAVMSTLNAQILLARFSQFKS